MIKLQRAVLASIVLLGALVLTSAPTAADPGSTPSPQGESSRVVGPARIEGDVDVRLLTMVSNNPGDPPGTVHTMTLRFIPQCRTGGCRTVLYRPRPGGDVRFVLVPRRSASGERVYRATSRPLADCNTPDGVISDAFTSVERIEVHTRRANASNVATKVIGELQIDSTPTAVGAAAGCSPGHFVYTFRSFGPFTT